MKARIVVGLTAALMLASAPARGSEGLKPVEMSWPAKGAELVVVPKPSTGLVWVAVVLRTGAASAPRAKEGLASFTAQALLRGTETRTREQIAAETGQLGTRIQVSVDHDYTLFHAEVLQRHTEELIDVLADVVLHPKFDPAELEDLRSEILGEIELSNEQDRSLAYGFFLRELYRGQPHGSFIIGTTSSVEAIRPADVRAFYEAHYVGSNMIFAAGGDVAPERFRALIGEKLDGLEKGKRPRAPVPEAHEASGIRILLVDKPDRSQNQIYLGQAVISSDDERYYPLLVANNAFGGMFTARLMQEVRVKRGWSYGASSQVHANRGNGYLTVWTFPANEDTLPTIELVLKMYRELKAEGIRAEELEAARSNLANDFVFKVETPRQLLLQWIDQEILRGDTQALDTFRSSVNKVSRDQANRAIREIARPDDLVVVMVCTASEYEQALLDLPGVEEVAVVPYDAADPDSARKVLGE